MLVFYPELVLKSTEGDIPALATKVREYFHREEEKFSAKLLLKNCGMETSTIDLDYPGAIVVYEEKGGFCGKIAVSSKISPIDTEFLKIHLLGRFFLDLQIEIFSGRSKKLAIKETTLPLQRFLRGQYKPTEQREKDADAFAAALIPQKQTATIESTKASKDTSKQQSLDRIRKLARKIDKNV